MTHNPLYRNEAELRTLIEYTASAAASMNWNWHDPSDKNVEQLFQIINDLELFRNFYFEPAFKKVYGCDLDTYIRRTYMGPSASNWSLDVPPKAEDFLPWFNDENAGKPVIPESPSAASGATGPQPPDASSKAAKRSSANNGETQFGGPEED